MRRNFAILWLFAMWFLLGLLDGCMAYRKMAHQEIESESSWTNEEYARFIKNNIALKNMKYSDNYKEFEFIVDTELGSTKIQNLIDLSAGRSIFEVHNLDQSTVPRLVAAAHRYVIDNYRYTEIPFHWLTIEDIMDSKKGDCKHLSLLLLSILLSMGVDSYAAISNGHMWVNVNIDGKWCIIELDQDSERKKIYALEGFYDRPLYKIYEDKSLKRTLKAAR